MGSCMHPTMQGTAFGGAVLGTIIARYGLNVALIVQALALGLPDVSHAVRP